MAEQKTVSYLLPDGVTKLMLRYLTWHPSDAAALEAHNEAEHMSNALIATLKKMESVKDAKDAASLNKLAVGLRRERNSACQRLIQALLVGQTEVDSEKVVNQCGETEFTDIMEICRSTPDYSERWVQTLTNNQPIPLLNTLLSLLVKTESGKASLQDTLLHYKFTPDTNIP